MDRQMARDLLPCFVCGDLPEPVAAQVRALLAAHPDLQAEAEALRGAEDACRELLAALAGALPELDTPSAALPELDAPSPPSAAPPAPLAAGRALLAAAAALVLVVLGADLLSRAPPVDGLLAQHQPYATQQAPGFLAETDPAALAGALSATAAGPHLGMVADLSPLGLELVGGGLALGARLGTVVVYEHDGKRYVCQMYGGRAPTDPPVALRQVGGRTLRAYQVGELAVVVWQEGGMVCLFSGAAPPEQLLAMVEAKLRRG